MKKLLYVFRLTLLCLLMNCKVLAQEPVRDSSFVNLFDTSWLNTLDYLSDTSFTNWLNDFSFNWDVPDSARFIKAFNTISADVKKDFATIKGDEIPDILFGKHYKVKTPDLPGTINNYIYETENLFNEKMPLRFYVAVIDSAANEKKATGDFNQWKNLLIQVFPAEAKKMKETGSDTEYEHQYSFIRPNAWQVALRKYRSTGKVELYIEKP